MDSAISYRNIWSISWPIIVGSAAQTLVLVADTAIVSRLGRAALGSEAIAGLVYLTMTMLLYGFAIGTQIVVARRHGEGRVRRVGYTVTHGFGVQWVMGAFLLLLAWAFSDRFMPLLFSDSSLVPLADSFFSYRMWGLLFASTNFGFRAMYVGLGRTKIIAVTTLVMVLVNIGLDFALVFGLGPFPMMGIAGAALASVVAEGTCTAVFLLFTRGVGYWRNYRLFQIPFYSFRMAGHILWIALPIMVQYFAGVFIWMLFFLIIESMGVVELAVSNVVRSLYVVMLIPVWGIGSAVNSLVSYLIGRGAGDRMWTVIRRGGLLGMLIAGGLAWATTLVPSSILSYYTGDAELIDLSRPILHVVAFATIAQAGALVLYSAVTGTGRTLVALGFDVVLLPLYIGLAWVFAHWLRLDLRLVWSVEIVYPLLLGAASWAYLHWGRWAKAQV